LLLAWLTTCWGRRNLTRIQRVKIMSGPTAKSAVYDYIYSKHGGSAWLLLFP
jgi:hypothetical protein